MFCDESEDGFGWIADEPPWLERTSHAIAAGGGVWLVDPVDFPGLDDRLRALGEPRAVLQLYAGHGRDSAALSARLGVPRLTTPAGAPGSPFETVAIKRLRGGSETALWWPERRTLVVSEAVGSVPLFCAPGCALGVHPLLRIVRPPRVLLGFEPEHILFSHGRGIHVDAAAALESAIDRARRDLPAALLSLTTAKKRRPG